MRFGFRSFSYGFSFLVIQVCFPMVRISIASNIYYLELVLGVNVANDNGDGVLLLVLIGNTIA